MFVVLWDDRLYEEQMIYGPFSTADEAWQAARKLRERVTDRVGFERGWCISVEELIDPIDM